MTPVELVLSKLPNHKRAGAGWLAQCPAHEDRKASLSINEGDDGRALVKCHAGCASSAVVSAMGLEMKDLMAGDDFFKTEKKPSIVKTYDYRDESGGLVFQVVRFEPKDFRQRRPDGKGGWNWSVKGVRVLPYQLPEILAEPKRAVVVVEGEKDVENLKAIGVLATCNAGGAGKWTPEHAAFLIGRKVIVLADNDTPGRKHAHAVAKSLNGVVEYVRIVELPDLPPKGDVSDWIAAGGTKESLKALAEASQNWKPEDAVGIEQETKPEEKESEPTGPRVTTLWDAATQYIKKVKAGLETLVDTGIPDLDYAIGGGVTYGEMVIVAARPSHGKSAIGLQMAHTMSANGLPVVMISEEMSALALGKRAIQFASATPEEHWKSEAHIVEEELDTHFRDRAPITIVESCGSVEKAVEQIELMASTGACRVALVDYAQLLDAKGKDRYERISRVSQTLRMAASRLQIIIIVLAQLNREIESRKTFVPMMSDIKETGQLEQDADVIIFGVWPHKVDPTKDSKQYQFYVAKNRNRAINRGAFECEFNPARQMLMDKRPTSINGVNFSQDFSHWQDQM